MKYILVLFLAVSTLSFGAEKALRDTMPDDIWADGVLKDDVAYSIQAQIYEKRREELNGLKVSVAGADEKYKNTESYKRAKEVFKSNGSTESAFNDMLQQVADEPAGKDQGASLAIRDCVFELMGNLEMLPAERANLLIRLDKAIVAQADLKKHNGMAEVYGNMNTILAWSMKRWKPKDSGAKELFFATYIDLGNQYASLAKGTKRTGSSESTGDVENYRENWQGVLRNNLGLSDFDIASKAWTKFYGQNENLAKSLCNKHIIPDLTDGVAFRMDVLKTFMTPFFEDSKSKQSEMVQEQMKKMLRSNRKLLDDAAIRKMAKDNSNFKEWLFQNVIKG